jgi:hypothetical protein
MFSTLKETMIFNSMFPNTDIILFFAKTVLERLYDQLYYKGEVWISKSSLQNSIEWHNDIEMDWFSLMMNQVEDNYVLGKWGK